MPKSRPFFSIVVPTRDRPDLLAYCLQSLRLQTFQDFEVIVGDNPTSRPSRRVFDQWADDRFIYAQPDRPLLMHDNWEFSCERARGMYVAVVIDKTVLRPSALQTAYDCVRSEPVDVLTWWNEEFWPDDESKGFAPGSYHVSYFRPVAPAPYSPIDELRRRFRWEYRRGMPEGTLYYRGKICFGAYHHELMARIKNRAGRVFFPVSPDYTSMVAALASCRTAVDLGRPLLVSMVSGLSTGRSTQENPRRSLEFLKAIDPAIVNELPVGGMYGSHHNIVSRDYQFMSRKLGLDLKIDLPNLLARAKEDIEAIQDADIRREQQALWDAACSQLSPDAKKRLKGKKKAKVAAENLKKPIRGVLNLFPGVKKRLFKALGRQSLSPMPQIRVEGSIVDAAKMADDYDAGKLRGLNQEA